MRGKRATWAIWTLGIGVIICALLPGTALAHALPVTYDPAPGSTLQASPHQVRITFSEQLNAAGSTIVVVNTSNQSVTAGPATVQPDQVTMIVPVSLLQPGTYVVGWRTVSALDGHKVGGSYFFHVANANGIVPPLTGPLPSGNVLGGGGIATNSSLDLPSILAALTRFISETALTVLLGIIFWWIFVLPRQVADDGLQSVVRSRMPQVADLAIETIVAGTVAEIIMQSIVLGGSWRGAVSWPIISSLLSSHYGIFLVARVLLGIAALICIWIPSIPKLIIPAARMTISLLFALTMVLAFVFSGHGGATSSPIGPAIDTMHLLGNGIWLGGLFMLSLIILPVIHNGSLEQRARYLAQGIPAFSIPAISGAVLLAITGPLNASVRMTAFSQLWTTGYGMVLLIKIALFIGMIAISYQHAFRLRPQLAAHLTRVGTREVGRRVVAPPNLIGRIETLVDRVFAWHATPTAFTSLGGSAAALTGDQAVSATPVGVGRSDHPQVDHLTRGILQRIQLEAVIGLLVLLCAAMLAPLASTLANTTISTSYGATGGNQAITATAGDLHVVATVNPGQFGTNTLTLQISGANGQPLTQGNVIVTTTMVEMDMGTNQYTLTPTAQPGAYSGQVAFDMPGHWNVHIIIHPAATPNISDAAQVTFAVGVGN